jgi:coenzyme PQQ precursor peptide PqqA
MHDRNTTFHVVPSKRGAFMKKQWRKPVIREICVGCEINSYYSGDF